MKRNPVTDREIGRKIQQRRRELGLTQEGLATGLPISASFVAKAERGAASFTGMSITNLGGLLEGLKWSAADFCRATGMRLSPALGGLDEIEDPIDAAQAELGSLLHKGEV